MKKLGLYIPLVLLLALAGCAINGNVYLSYDWDYTPNWLYTDDPHIPDIVVEDQEYLTQPGDYMLTYETTVPNVTYAWTVYYNLSAKPGPAPLVPGEDSRFQLFLHGSSYPVLIQFQGLAPVPGSTGGESPALAARSVTKASSAGIDRDRFELKQTYEYEQTQGQYTLRVRSELWLPKD